MMRRKISYFPAAVLSKDAWVPQLLWLLAFIKMVCRPEELWPSWDSPVEPYVCTGADFPNAAFIRTAVCLPVYQAVCGLVQLAD